MSACDHCRLPGACCRNIRLFRGRPTEFAYGEVGVPDWADPEKWLTTIQPEDLTLSAKRPLERAAPRALPDWDGPIIGDTLQTWSWTCRRVTPEGRCGDYENRPHMCRSFRPTEDTFCVMNPYTRGRGRDEAIAP